MLLKRLPLTNPTTASALVMMIGSPILLGLSALAGETWALPDRTDTWVSFVFLVLFASVMLYPLGYLVIKRWTASAFSYGTLLDPLVTIVVAAIVLAEPIRGTTILGGALIIGGTWLGAFGGPSDPLPRPAIAELEVEPGVSPA